MLRIMLNKERAIVAEAKIIQQVIQRTFVACGYELASEAVDISEREDGFTEIAFRFVVKREWRVH